MKEMKFHMLGRFEVHVIFKTYINIIYRCPSDNLGDNCETTYDLCDLANPCVGLGSNCSVTNGAIQCHCSQGNVKGSVLGIICYQEYKSGTSSVCCYLSLFICNIIQAFVLNV